jgi:hypothetical protein
VAGSLMSFWALGVTFAEGVGVGRCRVRGSTVLVANVDVRNDAGPLEEGMLAVEDVEGESARLAKLGPSCEVLHGDIRRSRDARDAGVSTGVTGIEAFFWNLGKVALGAGDGIAAALVEVDAKNGFGSFAQGGADSCFFGLGGHDAEVEAVAEDLNPVDADAAGLSTLFFGGAETFAFGTSTPVSNTARLRFFADDVSGSDEGTVWSCTEAFSGVVEWPRRANS